MAYAGGTFSGKKTLIAAKEAVIMGHLCAYEGRRVDSSHLEKITNWGPLLKLLDVRAFLGTVGLCRIFINNFAEIAEPLVQLTHKDIPFQFGELKSRAQSLLKRAVVDSPAIRRLDYNNGAAIILAVDSCNICIGYVLMQLDISDP